MVGCVSEGLRQVKASPSMLQRRSIISFAYGATITAESEPAFVIARYVVLQTTIQSINCHHCCWPRMTFEGHSRSWLHGRRQRGAGDSYHPMPWALPPLSLPEPNSVILKCPPQIKIHVLPACLHVPLHLPPRCPLEIKNLAPPMTLNDLWRSFQILVMTNSCMLKTVALLACVCNVTLAAFYCSYNYQYQLCAVQCEFLCYSSAWSLKLLKKRLKPSIP